MTSSDHKPLLILVRHAPHSSSIARAGVDTALAAAAFDQPVVLVFTGAGVCHMMPNQDGRLIGGKQVLGVLQSLPLYDIERYYVEAESAQQYGLLEADLPPEATLIDRSQLNALLADAAHSLGF